MDDRVAFLRARLDEDKTRAEDAGGGEWVTGCRCGNECFDYPGCERVEGGITIYPEGGHDADQAAHIARHDPARVLREVEAKRRMIEIAGFVGCVSGIDVESEILEALAKPYADHPDYNPEWRA